MFRNRFLFTSRLAARPSFLTGYGRALDVAGTFDAYNSSDSADLRALAYDWRVVGDQLCEALSAK